MCIRDRYIGHYSYAYHAADSSYGDYLAQEHLIYVSFLYTYSPVYSLSLIHI